MKKTLTKFQYPLVILVIMLVLTIAAPSSFLSVTNLSNVLWSISVVAIVVAGSIFPILTGGIDLSVGSMLGLTGVVAVKCIVAFQHSVTGLLVGILAALVVGAGCGLIHGFLISRFSVPPFLVTFASQIILVGVSMLLTDNHIIGCLEPKAFTQIGLGKLFGLPMPIYIMAVVLFVSYFVLNQTVFGRQVYAVGGNSVASELSGISSMKVILFSYAFSGFCAAIGGVVLSAMTQQAMSSMGSGYETRAITACVIGGVSLMGGWGTIQGAIFGAIIVGLINNGLNLLDVPSTQHGLILGAVIIVAVAVDALSHEDKKIKLFSFLKKDSQPS